ncbi:hypothetical protein OR1_01692 [Geobacter sp. OR-1]|uniref:type VI secretion system protein TssA n=1 Tax=Geobacter sp. OR-1 TaxID=1266765 RepID=UPI0005426E2F|nr:type VI secretion system protein TssA [Geobacter sp. OR-1]GAM09414.1 hypothetical protein OR1_01692 [Geobacter sp. OR-1]
MKREIDLDAILTPLPGENASGEDLRYTQLYEEIKDARKSEDNIPMGDWQRETRSADWERVVATATDALTSRTKDLQVAAWLTEALVIIEGFEGLSVGLACMEGLLGNFWDTVYPVIEDGDIEYRLAPFEFLNDRLSICIRQVPLASSGYSLLKWQESREVGYEADTRNKFGDIDETKKQRRDELIAEGRITAEQFDAAANQTPEQLRTELGEQIGRCREAFASLDRKVDEMFGRDAPRISEIGQALDECSQLVARIYGAKKGTVAAGKEPPQEEVQQDAVKSPAPQKHKVEKPAAAVPAAMAPVPIPEGGFREDADWDEAVRMLDSGSIREGLDRLLKAVYSMPSERERNRYRLLIAKLCIRAERHDLARPIVEGLQAVIDELHLERWESPIWIAEVLETLYQCLTSGEPSDDDLGRSQELFRRLCAIDVTKAIMYGR